MLIPSILYLYVRTSYVESWKNKELKTVSLPTFIDSHRHQNTMLGPHDLGNVLKYKEMSP